MHTSDHVQFLLYRLQNPKRFKLLNIQR